MEKSYKFKENPLVLRADLETEAKRKNHDRRIMQRQRKKQNLKEAEKELRELKQQLREEQEMCRREKETQQ